jgi:HK97 family phage portal protein
LDPVSADRLTASGLHVVEHRSLLPNGNDPATHPPATVGPPTARPGEVGAIEIIDEGPGRRRTGPPPAAPWSGWPAEWATPNWYGQVQQLTDTAWACLDKNASIFSSMPPYLVGASPSLNADWMTNPDPNMYGSWNEFAKQLMWDYQSAGEVFILVTARYATDWPARFHVVAPWMVDADMDGAFRRYTIGGIDVTADMIHIRYQSRTGDAHGHGPLEVGAPRLVAAATLARYAQQFAASGGVPNAVLTHPDELSAAQSADLQAQWVDARLSSLGMPAVLSGGVDFKTLQFNPADMALVELSAWNESRIAVLLGLPPFLMGLPSGGDSMTYSNTTALFDYHWRAGLRPMADHLMADLSGKLLPRGTTVEVNRDAYVQPGPYERAQTWEILTRIGVLSARQVGDIERLIITGTVPEGVM